MVSALRSNAATKTLNEMHENRDAFDYSESEGATFKEDMFRMGRGWRETFLKRNMEVGRLSFTTDGGPAIQDALAVFIAVGTPPAATGEADLSAIRVGFVASCERHPNADTLSLCSVDMGEGEPLQIVCGATNIAAANT